MKTERTESEMSYRRGVSQALSRACDVVRGGGTGDDLALLTDLSMEMRYEHKPYPAYLDQLHKKYRDKKDADNGQT